MSNFLGAVQLGKDFFFLFHIDDLIDDINRITAPGKRAFVFLVVKVKIFATVHFQLPENLRIFYRKFKFVGGKLSAFGISAETFLYKFSFIGFKDISFINRIIQMPRLHAFTENVVIFKPNKSAQYKENGE